MSNLYNNTTAAPSLEVKNFPTELVGFSMTRRSVQPQFKLGTISLGVDNDKWIYVQADGAVSSGSACNLNTSTFKVTDDDGVRASGSFLFGSNPSNNDTITLNGTAVTFKTSGATGLQVNIGVDLATTLASLKTLLNASASTEVVKCTYDVTGGNTLTVTYKTVGTTGNSFTLAASAATRSGATLSGGEADGNLIASSGAFADGEYGWIKLENAVT